MVGRRGRGATKEEGAHQIFNTPTKKVGGGGGGVCVKQF